jgi:hypothetical protein
VHPCVRAYQRLPMSAMLSKICPPRAERSERTSSPRPPHARVQRQKFDRTVVHGLLNFVRSRPYDQRPEFHAERVDVWIGVREGHERLQEGAEGREGRGVSSTDQECSLNLILSTLTPARPSVSYAVLEPLSTVHALFHTNR